MKWLLTTAIIFSSVGYAEFEDDHSAAWEIFRENHKQGAARFHGDAAFDALQGVYEKLLNRAYSFFDATESNNLKVTTQRFVSDLYDGVKAEALEEIRPHVTAMLVEIDQLRVEMENNIDFFNENLPRIEE